MNLSALTTLYVMMISFSNGTSEGDNSEKFTQMELAQLTNLLHGRGCTFYKKKDCTYFISMCKGENSTEKKRNEPARIAQIRSSHQGLIFLRNENKLMIEIDENGKMHQYILKQFLPEITHFHSMIIENEAKNQVIEYQEKMNKYYIFYSKI